VSTDDKLSHRPFAGRLHQLEPVVSARETAITPASEPEPEPELLPPVSDRQLFHEQMDGVRPLDGRDNQVPLPSRASRPRPPRDDEAEVMAQLADLVEGRAAFDFADTDEHIEGIGVGLDRRLLKRLRQGHFAVQGHLDLHGRTRQEARSLVERFLLESRQGRKRCVLIVHGRGLNSKDQIPVLKESLKVWLARGRIARLVLAFCSARPSDGGSGAVYVLLRK